MKTDFPAKRNNKASKRRVKSKSLRFRLTVTFVAFALLLMAMLWLMQTGLLEVYYERAMEARAEDGVNRIAEAYSEPEELDMYDFIDTLTELSGESDLYFSIRALDGSFAISSNDQASAGRMLFGGNTLVEKAVRTLMESRENKISYILDNGNGERNGTSLLVNASLVESKYRKSIFLIAVTPRTPLGPAVSIISAQLRLVTLIALALGALIALFYSKLMAEPVIEITEKAQELSRGNYDVKFDSAGYSEIEDLAKTLTHTAEELAKTDNLQKDLLANISHDLRTPLTMIKSYAELIRDISGENKERRDEHLQVIIEETDRLSDLVGDILAISKLQAGTEELVREPVDIQKTAESILNVYRVLEEQDGFAFDFRTVPQTVWVTGDERKLQQVMSNFISNAVKYSGDDKRIEVAFERSGSEITFSVSDHGPGIAEEDVEMIWNRYQKASRRGVRARGTSTGLGLSIAREILELHAARYGVDNNPGGGSRFWFTLTVTENNIDSTAVV